MRARPAVPKRGENDDENCRRPTRILYKGENLPMHPVKVLTVPQSVLYNECRSQEAKPKAQADYKSCGRDATPFQYNSSPKSKGRSQDRPLLFPKRNPESSKSVFRAPGQPNLRAKQCFPAAEFRAASPFSPVPAHKKMGSDRKGLLFP